MQTITIRATQDLAEQISVLRKGLNMDQRTFAAACGISAQSISALERGAMNPSLSTLLTICKSLNIRIIVGEELK